MRTVGLAAEMVEYQTGENWESDWATWFAARQSWDRLLDVFAPEKPEGWDEKYQPPQPLGLLASDKEEQAYEKALSKWKPPPQVGRVVADYMLKRASALWGLGTGNTSQGAESPRRKERKK